MTMIWVPIVSIVAFVLVLAPSIFIGIRVGWRAALFIAFVFLVFSTLWLVLGLILYDVFIWDVYTDLALKPALQSNVHLNLDYLASYYKPTILIIIIGLFSPLSALFTFGAYRALKRPLNKYLGHKVRSVNNAQKTIIVHKKRIYAHLSGGAILGVSALFIGSTVSSTLNVFLTPYYKSNEFNRFNDFLAKIYSFGQAGNTTEAQVIQQFLSSIDQNMIDGLTSLVDFEASAKKANHSPTTNALFYVANNYNKFADIFDYPIAAQAIFETILANSKSMINLFALDLESATGYFDENLNVIGLNKNAETFFINDWIAFLKDDANNLSTNNLPLTVRQVIYDVLMSKIMSFDKSIFIKEINDLITLKNANQKIIESRYNAKSNTTNEASKVAQSIKALVKRLSELSGRQDPNLSNYMIDNLALRNAYANVTMGASLSIDSPDVSQGLIANQIAITNSLIIQEENAFEVQNKAFQVSDSFAQSVLKNAVIALQEAQRATNQAFSNYQVAQNYYNSQMDRVDQATKLISSDRASKEVAANDLVKEQNRLATLESDIATQSDLLANTSKSDPSYPMIEANLTALNQQKSYCLSTISNLESKITRLNQSIIDQQKIIDSINQDKSQMEQDMQAKKVIWENAKEVENNASATESQSRNEYQILEKDYLAKKEVYNTYSNKRKNSKQKVDSLINEFNQGVNVTLINYQKNLSNLEHDFDVLTLKNDQVNVVATTTNLNWKTFNQNINDDNSIYWAEKHNQFLKVKLEQLQVIAHNKQIAYDQLLLQLENAFKDWALS